MNPRLMHISRLMRLRCLRGSRVHLLFITSRICPNRGGAAPPILLPPWVVLVLTFCSENLHSSTSLDLLERKKTYYSSRVTLILLANEDGDLVFRLSGGSVNCFGAHFLVRGRIELKIEIYGVFRCSEVS